MTKTVTLSEATKLLGMSPRTIHRWIRSGKVRAKQMGRKWYVDIDMEAVKDNGNVIHNNPNQDNTQRFIETLQHQLAEKDSQLARRDEQLEALTREISHLTQLIALQTKTAAQLSEQLSASRQMIEFGRPKPPLLKRLFRRRQ